MPSRWRQVVGWIAVGLSTSIACLWAFWGIIENFHEGWYYDSLAKNLGLMFIQYLSPLLFFIALSLVSIARPRLGSCLHALAGAALASYFRPVYTTTLALITTGPLLLLGALYWLGRAQQRKLAVALVVGLPLLTLVISGVYPAYLAATRFDDGNLEARLVEGNGIALVWAPAGPGWPSDGLTWQEAMSRCRRLSEDGRTLTAIEQSVWRLPTVEEAVRSLTRRAENATGVWDAVSAEASYREMPGKESPLWNIHSKVIYWWTSTSVNEEKAYIVVYNGKVWPREKRIGPGSLACRCVRDPADTALRAEKGRTNE